MMMTTPCKGAILETGEYRVGCNQCARYQPHVTGWSVVASMRYAYRHGLEVFECMDFAPRAHDRNVALIGDLAIRGRKE